MSGLDLIILKNDWWKMDSATIEIVGIGVTVGLAGAGGIGTLLKWSLDRNIMAMDKKIDELTEEVGKLRTETSVLRERAITDSECSACRKECKDGFKEWMARLDAKMDAMLLSNVGASRP